MSFNSLTLFDYGIALVILLFLIRGVWMGFVRQLAAFIAFIGSYWLAGRYAGELLPHVRQITESPKVVFLISFVVLLLASAFILSLTGQLLRKLMEVKLLGWFDRFFFGTLLGLTTGALVAVVLHMILASTLSPADYFAPDSLTAPYLDKGGEIARQLIQDATIREDLMPKEPAAQEGKKEKVEKPDTGKSAQPYESIPLAEAPDETEPTEAQLDAENDDPGSSTEILTH
jgi:membrane protein required for colicin V production